MENLKPCAICGKEMHNNEIHFCGGTPTLIHTCINGVEIKIKSDTKSDVTHKWNALIAVINRKD